MAEPGVILFGIVNVTALALGAAAAAPPRKNLDVLAGAALNFGIWILMLMLQIFYGARPIMSAFFLFDLLLMLGFYLIAHRRPDEQAGAVRNRDWASFVFFGYVLIVLTEIAHRALVDAMLVGRVSVALTVVFIFISAIIAARGFGAKGLFIVATAWAGIFFAALNFFVTFINLLTLAMLLIVATKGFREARMNVQAWMRPLPPKQPTDPNQRHQSSLA